MCRRFDPAPHHWKPWKNPGLFLSERLVGNKFRCVSQTEAFIKVWYPPRRKKTEILVSFIGFSLLIIAMFDQSFSMYMVYILYSVSSGKTYVGFTNDVNRRLIEHNVTEAKGFTLRYRPWKILHTEEYDDKKVAMQREKYLKTGRGREEIKKLIEKHLNAEK